MRKITYLLLSILIAKVSYTQSATELFNKGDLLYGQRNFKEAAIAYANGIREKGNNALLFRYSMCAAMWSLAGMADSAFHYLGILSASNKISNGDVDEIVNDDEFSSIKSDPRWQPTINTIVKQAQKNSFPQQELIYGRKDGLGLIMIRIQPKVKPNGKGIIYVQSGAWISLAPAAEFQTELLQPYLNKGYSVFVVMHGSQPRYAIPDAITDVRRAVRYVRYNSRKFGIDPGHIGITGFSSGGHLSLITAVTEDVIDSSASDPIDRVSSRVQAAAVLYPPTDFQNWGKDQFTILQDKDLIKNVRLSEAFNFKTYDRKARTLKPIGDSTAKSLIMKSISPIYFISSNDAPVFIIHGDQDKIVPLQQSESFIKKLSESGVPNKLIIKKSAGHSVEDMLPELYLFVDWFDQYLK